MKLKTPALLLSATLALAACWGEDDNSNDTQATTETTQSVESDVNLTQEYLLALEIPASRNGIEFTVNVEAYCGRVEQDNNYAANCEAEAISYIQEKFMCSRYPLAPGGTKIDNQAIVEAGLTGNYREFPSQYLFTDEELQAAIEQNETLFNKRDIFVITDISDLDAASLRHPIGRVDAPTGPLCE